MHHRNITRQSFIAAIERGIHAAPGLDAATFADAYDDWIDRYYGAAPTTRSIELTVLG
jgi:hypothetical protein